MKKLFILFFILLLSGCFNYKELNTLDVVSSIGIDKKSNKYLVTIQVLNGKQSENSEDSQIVTYSSTGNSINDALRNITTKTSKELYKGHINNIIISEEIAKENIINITDIFLRLTEVRDELNIIIVKNESAKNTLKILTTEELVPSEYLKLSLLNNYKKTASTVSNGLDKTVSLYLKKHIDPIIPVIKVVNYKKKGTSIDNITTSNPISKIEINNAAITYNGKFEDYLNKNETIGYNFLSNNVKNIVIPVKCDNGKYSTISLIKSNTKRKTYKNNNSYAIKFNINSKGNITEYNCDNDLNNDKNINKLEKKVEKKIKKYIQDSLIKQNSVKSKFLGLERYIYLDYKDYNNEKINVKVNVNVNIKRKGEIITSLRRDKYE